MLIERLKPKTSGRIQLNDAARSALLLARRHGGDLLSMLKKCDHGQYLASIGMEGDLPLCAADSVTDVVPMLKDEKLMKLGKA
jgi:2-phosphosulfolactate phosphatase